MGLNMYDCHTLITISMPSLWMICTSSCVVPISVHLCVFSACWLTPGPLCSCQCPALALRGPRGVFFFFLLGYADKLMLPDWLTAPPVAGTGRNVLWIPSDGREPFSLSSFSTTIWHRRVKKKKQPRISEGPSLRKKLQIQPKIWIKNLILISGASDQSRCKVWILAIAPPFLTAPTISLPFTPFLSL